MLAWPARHATPREARLFSRLLGEDAAGFLVSAPFLDSGPQVERNFPFGEFTLAGGWRYHLHSLLYRLRSLWRR
jgi:hypothetical protein